MALCRDIRRKPLAELVAILTKKLAEDEVTFDGSAARGRTGIRGRAEPVQPALHLPPAGTGDREPSEPGRPHRAFDKLVNREVKNPFDIEHIWADDFEAVKTMFASEAEFHGVAQPCRVAAAAAGRREPQPAGQALRRNARTTPSRTSTRPACTKGAYLNQPKFAQFQQAHASFEPHNTHQSGAVGTEGAALALMQLIWSPERLGHAAQ